MSQRSKTPDSATVGNPHQTRSVTRQQANIAAYTKSLLNQPHDISVFTKPSQNKAASLLLSTSTPFLPQPTPEVAQGLSVSTQSLDRTSVTSVASSGTLSRTNSSPSLTDADKHTDRADMAESDNEDAKLGATGGQSNVKSFMSNLPPQQPTKPPQGAYLQEQQVHYQKQLNEYTRQMQQMKSESDKTTTVTIKKKSSTRISSAN
jgi:hypothetical protein